MLMLRRWYRKVVAGLLLSASCAAGFAIAPAAASAQTYMECDAAFQSFYPHVWAAPPLCNLGMGSSYYDVQNVPGRAWGEVALRGLRWSGWGAYEATAHGLGCDMYRSGAADWSVCTHVTVNVYDPQSIGPAGGAVIYQSIRVRHNGGGGYHRFTWWYEPGTDY
jgi:hypothetical protein